MLDVPLLDRRGKNLQNGIVPVYISFKGRGVASLRNVDDDGAEAEGACETGGCGW